MNEEARTFDPSKGASPIPVPDGEPISDLYDAYVNGIKADFESFVNIVPTGSFDSSLKETNRQYDLSKGE